MKLRTIVLSLVLLTSIGAMACSSMPWCKDADTWSERITKARVELQRAENAAEALLLAGQITKKQFDEVMVVVSTSRMALDGAEVALSLCMRGSGASTRIDRNLEEGEAGATAARKLTEHYTGANVRVEVEAPPKAKEK